MNLIFALKLKSLAGVEMDETYCCLEAMFGKRISIPTHDLILIDLSVKANTSSHVMCKR